MVGFHPKADVFGEGKRSRFVGLSRLVWRDVAPVPSGSDHPGLRVDRLLGSGSRGNEGSQLGQDPPGLRLEKRRLLEKTLFVGGLFWGELFLEREGG